MKNFILFLLFLIQCNLLFARNPEGNAAAQSGVYYVKVTGGNGDGLSDATAWSFEKLNSTHVMPGSTVLFRKDDVFYGRLNTFSGQAGNLITYGAYGAGANPKISGLSVASSWTRANDNIYYTSIDVPELNVVTLDGKIKGMGRYPKTGYLVFTGHSGTSSISGPSIGSLPFDPTGAEVVIRKHRQITDRHLVTTYSGNKMGLSGAGKYGTVFLNNNNDAPSDGNGYFIQSHIKTLTDLGDWYYDNDNNRLYMHFGADSPDNHVVKASTVPVLVQMDNKSHILFDNLDFEGANRDVVNMNNNNFITFSGCRFGESFGGVAGDNGVSNLLIQGGTMTDILSSAVFIPGTASHITIDGLQITNAGIIPGAGGSGGGQQLGIWLAGDDLTVKNSTLKNIGYHGIVLYGDNTLIEKNLIDRYGLTKDDCGGVYEFQFTNVKSKNKIIRKNIILNGVGEPGGAPAWEQYGQASAIYLDVAVNNVEVYENILAHGNWGGLHLIGSGDNNKLTNNLVYDFSKGFLIYSYETLKIRNTTVTGNHFISKTAKQYPIFLEMFAEDDPSLYGKFDNNVYARLVDDNKTVGISKLFSGGSGLTTISLATWKSSYRQDANSSKSKVIADQDSDIRFDYNYSGEEAMLTLGSVYSDVDSTLYPASIKMPPLGGVVLVKIADVVQTIGSGSWTDRSIWSSGSVPGPTEYVLINRGHSVTVSQNISAKNIHVHTDGKLLFLGNYKVEK